MKSQLLAAAFSGVILGVSGLAHAQTQFESRLGSHSIQLDSSDGAKHGCKGQNACKGQGGCKTDSASHGDKNSCSGKGVCGAT